MDVEEIPCKFSMISKMADQYPENDEEDGVSKIRKIGNIISTTDLEQNGGLVASRLRGWHNSSRIFRVSRASGGKDRHSKVLTSKGLRDRRVRLSVSTAISFYDLQDRLGYDQPSKAVEWLIKAADEAINELPSLNTPFSDMPLKQLGENVNVGAEPDYRNYQQQISGCSSTSETSKGSGLSVSRSDVNVRVNREKARERARERASKEKESETHLPSTNSSFTDLLNAGISKQNSGGGGDCGGDGLSLFRKSEKQWQPPSMDYFDSSRSLSHSNLGFGSGQIQLGNNNSMMMMIPPFASTGENHNPPELQHFSFMQPNNSGGNDENYNLNFTIAPSSSNSSGFNNSRGTLQSNSSVPMLPHHHLQRFNSIDGATSNVLPFFMGATPAPSSVSAAAGHLESSNHHQHYHHFGSDFDGSLQLYHGDGIRHSDHKGKGKN